MSDTEAARCSAYWELQFTGDRRRARVPEGREKALDLRPQSVMAAAECRLLSGPEASAVLEAADTLLFDCDGVIWRGEAAIPGAAQLINRLQERGKRVLYMTNNSTKTRAMYTDKLRGLGFRAETQDVFATAFCSALYLQQKPAQRGKVYVLGAEAVSEELRSLGIACIGPGPDPLCGAMGDWAALPRDSDVGAVLVAFDPHFSYMKLVRAAAYLRDPGCRFLATNTDTRLPLEAGAAIPGTGCLVRAVEAAAQRTATVIGKPSAFMFRCAAERFGLDPARTIMVGDRLDTDILLGTNCGLRTILTLTGVSTLQEAESHRDSGEADRRRLVPDYYVHSVADLLPALD
ncbi:glycerol-3-phosphate phosphatase [Callorhinchus milii]|uniref:Glycerol-3-phosphate phosphatase n=1 Tax=Callorhinchus milii TaxID=7868 RepID=A0A4W3H723_CALMI|nr:glycerol-3-phosphate phosphatase [Callorhinchus milii]|eukprot:gi/632952181/ref/XP_007891714.1/ PREDICTED: phosphoglycolate phosphatase [Callorhinchus milii]